jgi:peptide/nickel transport system substrate-binding protein
MQIYGCSDTKNVSVGFDVAMAGFDPVYHHGLYEDHIYGQTFETLFVLDDDCRTIRPHLVEKWSISDNKNNYWFKLKKDIQFHNKKFLRAADVIFTLKRYQEFDNNWYLSELISDVKMVDSLSFEISLIRPYAPFLYALASPYVLLIQTTDETNIDLNPMTPVVGTGPFILKEIHDNQSVILRNNPLYARSSSEVAEIIFRYYEKESDQVNALIRGEVDIIYMVSGKLLDRLVWTGKVKYALGRPLNVMFIGFNNQHDMFADPRIRRAFLHSLDIPKLVYHTNRGNAEVAVNPLPPVYIDKLYPTQASRDQEAAENLFRMTGYNKGIQIMIHHPAAGSSRPILAELIQTQLEEQGLQIHTLINKGWTIHNQEISSEDTQMFVSGYDSEIIGDPGNLLRTLFHSESDENYFRYDNALVDSLLTLAENTFDNLARDQIYRQVVSEIISDTPAVFLSHIIPHFAYRSDKIKALSLTPYQTLNFQTIQLVN